MRTSSLHVVALLASFCCLNASSLQEEGAAVVVNGFVNAWNSHDMDAFSELFAEDAIWVPVAESRLQGRGAILKDFTLIHTTWAKTTTIASSDVTVQTLSPDVSAIFLRLQYLDANGQRLPRANHAVLIVAAKMSGRWKIASGQITKLAA